MRTNVHGETFHIDSRIILPKPLEGEKWDANLVTQVDDIDDDGYIYFCDDEWCDHKCHMDRVQLFDIKIITP